MEWRNTSSQFRHLSFTFKKPATLILSNVAEKDEGIYRCRIDYSSSATKNYRVSLLVIGEFELILDYFFYHFV